MEIDLERSLVGGILKNPNSLVHCVGIKREDFKSPRCAIIFDTARELWRKKEEINTLVIHKQTGIDINELLELEENSISANIGYLVKEIIETAKKKRILKQLEYTIESSSLSDSAEILSEIINIYKHENIRKKKNPDIKTAIKRFSRTQEENRTKGKLGISTGLELLDRNYIEFVPGQLWMIGAYTSTGKTALMTEIISRIYKHENPKTIIISTEMTEEMLISRYIANRTGINAKVIYSGNMIEKHREFADAVRDELAEKNIKIYDDIKTIEEIEQVVRLDEMQGGSDLVFLDFVQNIRKPNCRSKYEETSQIAIDIQNLAKDSRTCIVCLSQITLSQTNVEEVVYKGAGELAEAADIGVHLKRNKKNGNILMLDVKKNRHGAICSGLLEYKDNFTRLEEAEQ